MRKASNAFDVLSSFYLARMTGKPRIKGMPLSIAVEPTTSCNLRCPECPSGLRSFTRPTGMLDPRMLDRLLDELAPTLTYLTFYFQGEPYLHPAFTAMVSQASSRNIYTATSTNGHYLDEKNAEETVRSGLDRLIISLDGASQETYRSYRQGGNLARVTDGARNIVAAKQRLRSATPQVIFQFIVFGHNEHEIPEIHKLAREVGVDQVALKTAQINDYRNGSPLIPRDDKYSRYRRGADGRYEIKSELGNHCWKMWSSCVVTWDGRVVPCCFDKDASNELGSLANQSFREIWNGKRYDLFRAQLLRARAEIDICSNCTEGLKVWT